MARGVDSADLASLIREFPNYRDPKRIQTDVLNVSRHNDGMRPFRGTLTLNTGQECQLLMLRGTVPIIYLGTQYSTPIEIYISENYPDSPPTCYVRPSPGMSLEKGHSHVDSSGLVYLPYLHFWQAKSHNLVELCAHMSGVFGAKPPLFVRPPQSQPSPQSRPSYPNPSPAPAGGANPQYSGSPYGTGNPTNSYLQGNTAFQQAGSPYGGGQPAHSAAQPRPTPMLPPRPNPEVARREKEIQLTSKLQCELQAMYNQLRSEMDSAFETQAKLEENKVEVEANVEELTRRKMELKRLLEVSRERSKELDAYLEERKKEGEPCVDDLIEPKDALSDQLLQLVAENSALEDGLYYLDVGVTDGAITVDVFLREVRKLARKQFVARATTKKVERTQQSVRKQEASFKAEQARNRNSAGYYPNVPDPQQATAEAGGYRGAPPPGYTPTAMGGNMYVAGSNGTWGTGGASGAAAAGGGAYPSFAGGRGYGQGAAAPGGYGAQTPYTQRR